MLPGVAARITHLDSPRLWLRRWTRRDLPAFAAMNADAAVNEHLLGPLDAATSRVMLQRMEAHFAVNGFGLWALERREDGQLLGFAGLQRVPFDAAFTPAIEVGWRLLPEAWGQGYATEAARAAIEDGFERLGIEEIVAFTVPANTRSEAVMQRLGMQRDVDGDFEHPRLPEEHPLRLHRLYRLRREDWPKSLAGSDGATDREHPQHHHPGFRRDDERNSTLQGEQHQ
jgi:RimJ/RimL family protein N-acetyltransferase